MIGTKTVIFLSLNLGIRVGIVASTSTKTNTNTKANVNKLNKFYATSDHNYEDYLEYK
jgi:hypothetical protein